MAPKSADRLLAEDLIFNFPNLDPYQMIDHIKEWLDQRDAVLTPKGVKRGSDWRKGHVEEA